MIRDLRLEIQGSKDELKEAKAQMIELETQLRDKTEKLVKSKALDTKKQKKVDLTQEMR